MTTTHPTGRMLRRALQDTPAEMRWIESGRMGFASNGKGCFIMPLVIRKSLNTTGSLFRGRELDWFRLTQPNAPALTSTFIIDHLAKPVTKKDILTGYLMAARYNNNFKPRV